MKKTSLLLFTCALLSNYFSSFSYAVENTEATCTRVDLSEVLGPPRDQGDASWCFAYAAADLLTFYTHQKISAADIAFHEIKKIRNSDDLRNAGGGNLDRAVERAFKIGMCLESQLPSNSTALQAQYDHDPEHFWAQIDAACSTRLQFKKPDSYASPATHGQELIRTLDAVLEAQNIASIGIDADVFYDLDIGRKQINHRVLVVGRRWNGKDKTCEYHIRNSWGESCDHRDRRYTCENGHIWLSEENLKKVSQGISFLYQN